MLNIACRHCMERRGSRRKHAKKPAGGVGTDCRAGLILLHETTFIVSLPDKVAGAESAVARSKGVAAYSGGALVREIHPRPAGNNLRPLQGAVATGARQDDLVLVGGRTSG